MHVQRDEIDSRAAPGATTGSRCSAAPRSRPARSYPDIDLLHVGEIGDATDTILLRLDAEPPARPSRRCTPPSSGFRWRTSPSPAYDLLDMTATCSAACSSPAAARSAASSATFPPSTGSARAASGSTRSWPNSTRCSPAATPARSTSSTTTSSATPGRGRTPRRPGRWQREHGYPIAFACEATMNIAKRTDILERMRQARFVQIFMGIESPDSAALKAMRKNQNLSTPLLTTVERLNNYGMEVVGGIIMGLDSDDAQTGDRILAFVEASQIPMLTINLLHALPHTPLWDRLKRAGRLPGDVGAREQCRLPAPLRRRGGELAAQHRLRQRSGKPVRALAPPRSRRFRRQPQGEDWPGEGGWSNLRHGAVMVWRVTLHICLLSDFPQAVLAPHEARVASRADRRPPQRGFHELPPDPLHARRTARRPERLHIIRPRSGPPRWPPPTRRQARSRSRRHF